MDEQGRLVVEDDALHELCDELAAEPVYGFDTEFHTERSYFPELALIQIAWRDKVALVDPLAVDPAPLGRVLAGPGIAVGHAVDQDLDVLRKACGSVPATVFDTQVVAGFLGMTTPSLARLVESLLGVTLPKADRLSDWIRRPMSAAQVSYASNDVAHLLELRSVLTERLERLGRLEWALDECAELFATRRVGRVPEETWWKMGDIRRMSTRQQGVAQEVSAWRERRAAELNRPRRSVLSDLALLTISQRPPRSRDELLNLRGVENRHVGQGAASEILSAVRRGLDLKKADICLPPDGTEAQAPPAAVSMCAGVVRQIADNLQFDQGLLATRSDIARMLCGDSSRLDHGWRAELVGGPLRKLIAGEVAVAFDTEGHLVIEERSGERHPLPGGEGPA